MFLKMKSRVYNDSARSYLLLLQEKGVEVLNNAVNIFNILSGVVKLDEILKRTSASFCIEEGKRHLEKLQFPYWPE